MRWIAWLWKRVFLGPAAIGQSVPRNNAEAEADTQVPQYQYATYMCNTDDLVHLVCRSKSDPSRQSVMEKRKAALMSWKPRAVVWPLLPFRRWLCRVVGRLVSVPGEWSGHHGLWTRLLSCFSTTGRVGTENRPE